MSTPTPPREDLPRFFLDRNMGSIAVPRGLRALGLPIVTLSERYGVGDSERVTRSLDAIVRACARPGPFVYRIHPERIERLRLPGAAAP